MSTRSAAEQNILAAAKGLLESGGPSALTTRAVCGAAGVTAPTLYHYFGTKDGLAMALVTDGIGEFMARKRMQQRVDDPVEDLRRGWDVSIEFGLQHQALYKLVISLAAERPELLAPSYQLMQARIERLSDARILAVTIPEGCRIVWAASTGTLSLLQIGASPGEIRRTSNQMFEAVLRRLQAQA